MNKALVLLVIALGVCFGHGAVRAAAWDEFNALDLKMSSPRGDGYAAWRLLFDKESRDVQVDAEDYDGENIRRGRILLIGGRVLASRGPITEPGFEIDALDAPILERHLVTQLLERSMPAGSAGVMGAHPIDFTDDKTGIKFAAPSVQGFIPAPWHVRGDVKIVATDLVEFTLALTVDRKSAAPGQANGLDATFTGRLSRVAGARIEDTMSLDGWTVLDTAVGSGPAAAASGNGTVADVRKKPTAEK